MTIPARYGQDLWREVLPDLKSPLLLTGAAFRDRVTARLGGGLPVALLPAATPEAAAEVSRLIGAAGAVIAAGDGSLLAEARRLCVGAAATLVVAPTVVNAEAVETGLGRPADLLAVDYGLVWGQDEDKSLAAAGEILSLLTATADRRRASTPDQFDEARAERALEIVDGLLDRAEEIHELTPAGIRALYELFLRREQLVEEMGSRRAVAGAEHVFAARARREVQPGVCRGQLLCLGTVLMSEVLGQGSRAVKQFLHWIQAPWKPEDMGLNDLALGRILAGLRLFAREIGRPDTVLEEVELKAEKIQTIIAAMREPIVKSSFQDRPKEGRR